MGTRLGRSTPKPLTRLRDGRTIQRRQLDALREAFGAGTDITVVVGFGSDLVMAASPTCASPTTRTTPPPTPRRASCVGWPPAGRAAFSG
ncbi:hypothetical protein [Blastococcus brunescens]|uniref:Uncharacterized protein n=1 Tax=Blastococcus brunescens TaxID=1564165 RepID=A0ABZ1B2Q1_9ACTN|nr:hypothetical protein [Blastococcus sp. BMG 8361]WRL65092.1 hypothetical protein U6N30_05215 [Blastococcus sp. BMG 8361]